MVERRVILLHNNPKKWILWFWYPPMKLGSSIKLAFFLHLELLGGTGSICNFGLIFRIFGEFVRYFGQIGSLLEDEED